MNEHHRAIREMENQVIQQIQHTDKVADESVVVQRQVSPRTTETKHRIFKLTVNISKQRIFKLIDLAHEIIGVKVAQKTWHKLLDDASTKVAVADDTANSNTSISSRVNQTTLSDFSRNLEEPFSHRERGGRLTIMTRSMDSHEIQCEKEYLCDLRTDTGTLFFPDKIVMEQHSLTPSQTWCKVQESIKGLHDKYSKFEIEQGNVTDTPQCVISAIDHGEQIDHRHTGKGKSIHTGKGKGNHVDVVEANKPFETASTVMNRRSKS